MLPCNESLIFSVDFKIPGKHKKLTINNSLMNSWFIWFVTILLLQTFWFHSDTRMVKHLNIGKKFLTYRSVTMSGRLWNWNSIWKSERIRGILETKGVRKRRANYRTGWRWEFSIGILFFVNNELVSLVLYLTFIKIWSQFTKKIINVMINSL